MQRKENKPQKQVQLRGDKLRQVIMAEVRKIAAAAAENGQQLVKINVSKLASTLGVMRSTVIHHSDAIEEVLKEFQIQRDFDRGRGQLQYMQEKTERLELKIKELSAIVEALRLHHVTVYERLYQSSQKVAAIVTPTLLQESVEMGQCMLCAREVTAASVRKKNIVKFGPKPKN